VDVFDIVVCSVAALAVVMGFHAGLLRSLATIAGYLAAAPIAVAITPGLAAVALGQDPHSPDAKWLALCIVFVATGFFISALLRIAIGEFTGPDVGLADRAAGAALGAVRIGLCAMLVVVAFDRVIPADRQPPFLAHSRLRPYLSAAGQQSLQSLPPDVQNYLDRLKQERGI
jgi:membrane protein required for colicin V production